MERKTILIIDDSILVIEMLSRILSNEYRVCNTTDASLGVGTSIQVQPDLILLDIVLGRIDGFEVCRQLKAEPKTRDIPVIFLTSTHGSASEARGFEIGGVDYIIKPFNPVVVQARIKTHIQMADYVKELQRLYSLALDANPITFLPGNNSIQMHISQLLVERKYTVCYADLDHFKSYNDRYGFANGDRIIHFTAELMKYVSKVMGIEDIFFGHIGGDDFVFTLDSRYSKDYVHTLLDMFDRQIRNYYHIEDLLRGYIIAKDRNDSEFHAPIISLSIAGLHLADCRNASYFEVNDLCTALKCMAKKIPGSVYLTAQETYRAKADEQTNKDRHPDTACSGNSK